MTLKLEEGKMSNIVNAVAIIESALFNKEDFVESVSAGLATRRKNKQWMPSTAILTTKK